MDQAGGRAFVAVFSLVFISLGSLIILQAFGYGDFFGRALVPGWVLGTVGLAFLLAGLGFLAKGFGFEMAVGEIAGSLVALCILAVFNYIAFTSMGDIARVVMTGIDILVLMSTADYVIGRMRGVESPIVERLKHLPDEGQKGLGFLFLAAPFGIAMLLAYLGVLDRIADRASGRPGVVASAGQLRIYATRESGIPLTDYAGTWVIGHNQFGGTWVTRAEVRIEGDRAKATLWRACGAKDCPSGTYDMRVESSSRGFARGLHITGKHYDWDWALSLRPNPGDMRSLMVWEGRILGADWNTNRQQTTSMKRAD